MHDGPHDLTAFILAGGRSSRMGSDKAFLELDGESLLGRMLLLAQEVTSRVRIVGEVAKFADFGAVIEDVYRDCGPLGGIHAALNATTTELNLFLGVDMPFVEPRLLRYLVDQARGCDALVTVPRFHDHFETLCAVYRRGFAEIAETALRAGRNKIDPLFAPAITRVIGQEQMRELDFDRAMFDNLNTREDWERARRSIHR